MSIFAPPTDLIHSQYTQRRRGHPAAERGDRAARGLAADRAARLGAPAHGSRRAVGGRAAGDAVPPAQGARQGKNGGGGG